MKSIKHALLGLLLTSCAAFAAATPIVVDPIWVMADLDEHGGSLQMFNFGEGGDGVKAGDAYTYDFWFNTPPPTAWFGFTVNPDSAGSLTFSDASFSAAMDPSVVPPGTLSAMPDQVSGNFVVDSGLYDLHLTVNYLADGASFTGVGSADFANVPEPISLALMGAGLAGLAGARRRRKAA